MRSFFKNILSSCLGVLLFFTGIFLIFLLIGLSTSAKPTIKSDSVLRLNLNTEIIEKESAVPPVEALFGEPVQMSLYEILDILERAKSDSKISGILLESSYPNVGLAKAALIRDAIEDFKKSGKFVYAYGSNYTQMGYYIASTADSVFLNPNGMLDMKGMGIAQPYFKELMDELGIGWNIYYAGQFKSATEPFRRKEMSDQNRTQMREYITEVYDNFLMDIAKSRQVSVESVDQFVADFSGMNAAKTVEKGLIDELLYQDQLDKILKTKLSLDQKKKIPFVEVKDYLLASKAKPQSGSKNKIAVVYAEGQILEMGEEKGVITSQKFVETLSDIRRKKDVKAVVLRINSPGGSGFASDEIWREIELLKADSIPVVVSMSDYAASGGYYIACNADAIVASPNTLTGSIGVFAMIPDLSKMSEEKLKIHWDSVKTHQYANAFNPFFNYSDGEHKKLQAYIDNFYDIFLTRVAEGRNMSKEKVHAVAQGRIWTGRKAKEIGLVDELGELDTAIKLAAKKAGIKDYKTDNYPKYKTTMLDEIIKNIDLETKIKERVIGKTILDKLSPYSRMISQPENYGKPQFMMTEHLILN
ncbi:MAG TPA: signal peptide peptidase SppA [Saprospiraceae bacterium]|nr:signal peptide peptidase SppA [Saprospiraceae bacterium]